jgi:hypothetical protein
MRWSSRSAPAADCTGTNANLAKCQDAGAGAAYGGPAQPFGFGGGGIGGAGGGAAAAQPAAPRHRTQLDAIHSSGSVGAPMADNGRPVALRL